MCVGGTTSRAPSPALHLSQGACLRAAQASCLGALVIAAKPAAQCRPETVRKRVYSSTHNHHCRGRLCAPAFNHGTAPTSVGTPCQDTHTRGTLDAQPPDVRIHSMVAHQHGPTQHMLQRPSTARACRTNPGSVTCTMRARRCGIFWSRYV